MTAGEQPNQSENGTPVSHQGNGTDAPVSVEEAREYHTLDREDAGDVSAVQVSMDRSGAESIDAQRVSMTQSGARTISARTAQLDNSGVLAVRSDRAEFNHSSAILAQAQDITFTSSKVGIGAAGTVRVEGDTSIGWLNTGVLTSQGNIRAGLVMSGTVEAGGDIRTIVSPPSAAALGAGFAVALFVLRKVIKRPD